VSASIPGNRRIERAGVNALCTLLEEHDQIVQTIDGGNDFGEDLFVMLTRQGERTGASIAVQVKSGDKYKRANGYAIPVGAHASDWRNAHVPVFGVVYDIGSRQLFWVNLTETLESSEEAPTWIPVPREQQLHAGNLDSFLEVANTFVEQRPNRHAVQAAVQVSQAVATSPAAPSWFVGRRVERQTIIARLADSGRRLLVSGMAGVGKTCLVDWVVGDPETHALFSGGVVIADMHGFSVGRAQLAHAATAYAPLLSSLGVPATEVPPDIESQAALYHRTLNYLVASGRPALLVFDNVAELSQVAELLPRDTSHGVIITSRSRLGIIEGFDTIKLECLDPSESQALFGNVLSPSDGRLGDQTSIQAITELCGHLPLALSISVAILSEDPDLAPADLVEELTAEKTRLDVLQFADTAVRAALHVSLLRLEESLRTPFCRLSIHPGSQMSEQIAASVLGESDPRARSILRRLGQASLIARIPGTARWRMHDLVHLFAAEQCRATVPETARRLAFDRIAGLYTQISHDANLTLTGQPEGSPPRFDAAATALSWFDTECANLQATAGQAQELAMPEHAYVLSMNLVLFLDLRGRALEGLQSARTAHDAAHQERNEERQVRALNNVGAALNSLHRFEDAIVALMEAIDIAERIDFLDGQCDATITLGTVVRQHRSPAEAIPILTRAVALAQRNRDVNDLGTSLTNLGTAYREAGDLNRAAIAYSKSIRYHRASGDGRKEASAHAGLGTVLFQLGRLAEAETALQAAFPLYREVQDEFGIHLNYINLGNAQLQMGRLPEARTSLQLAHQYFRGVSNEYYEASAQFLLGALECVSGNFGQAQVHYRAALQLYRSVGAHEHIASVENSLSHMLGVSTLPE
jgi:tetratricopeptide (TPR) repeat protein